MIRLFVSGPLTDSRHAQWHTNIQRAIDSGNRAKDELGVFPFIPHLFAYWDLSHPKEYEVWMEQCFVWLEVCDALWRLPGKSSGADREAAHAKKLGIPVFETYAALCEWVQAREVSAVRKAVLAAASSSSLPLDASSDLSAPFDELPTTVGPLPQLALLPPPPGDDPD